MRLLCFCVPGRQHQREASPETNLVLPAGWSTEMDHTVETNANPETNSLSQALAGFSRP